MLCRTFSSSFEIGNANLKRLYFLITKLTHTVKPRHKAQPPTTSPDWHSPVVRPAATAGSLSACRATGSETGSRSEEMGKSSPGTEDARAVPLRSS